MGFNKNETKEKSRGREPNPNYSEEVLLSYLRKILLEGNREKLTKLKLEKLTGVPRRNWNKVEEQINKINDGIAINIEGFMADFPLPNIEEVFKLYYGKNREKLKQAFKDYNLYINQMWEKYSNFEELQKQTVEKLAERNIEIETLKEKLKEKEIHIEYYKRKYEQICSDSSNISKRKGMQLTENKTELKKGDKNQLNMNFVEEFKDILK